MLRIFFMAAALTLAPATAFAHSCPALMGKIDAALQTASLSEADMTKVKELRAEGEKLHGEGNHDGSMAALEEAKAMLGL